MTKANRPIDLDLHALHLLAHVEDDFDPGKVDSQIPCQGENRLETLQGLFIVEAGVALASWRGNEALPLIKRAASGDGSRNAPPQR